MPVILSYNKDLLLLLVLALFPVNGVALVIAGLSKQEKATNYGPIETITGIINLAIFFAVLII